MMQEIADVNKGGSEKMLNFALVQRLLPFYRALWWLCSILPLRLHYFFADVLIFPLVFHVLKYRRVLVQRQLAEAFPSRSAEERAKIERDFYHWFADYIVETLKLMSISRKELYRRMDFVNLHEVLRELRDGEHQFVFLYLGHFGNWEWVSSLPLWSDGGIHFGQIYHPLHSPLMDELFLHVRGRMGATNIAMKETLRTILSWKKNEEKGMIGFISDQSPKWEAMHHWCDFLHHETSFFTGAEKIGQKVGARYYYLDITRPHRGEYRAELIELKAGFQDSSEINGADEANGADDAKTATPSSFPITDAYVQTLEASIEAHPHLWLWTHNRWKRTKKEWDERQRKNTTQ